MNKSNKRANSCNGNAFIYERIEHHQKLVVHLRASLLYTHTHVTDEFYDEMFCMVNGNRISHTHRTECTVYISQYSFIFHTISLEWLVSPAILSTIHLFTVSFFYSIPPPLHSFVLLFLFCYCWTFNSSSWILTYILRYEHIYLSMKFYILLVFTGYIRTYTYQHTHTHTHLGWDIYSLRRATLQTYPLWAIFDLLSFIFKFIIEIFMESYCHPTILVSPVCFCHFDSPIRIRTK